MKRITLKSHRTKNLQRQNQQMYMSDPLPYAVQQAMNTYSPDEIDTAIAQLGGERPDVRTEEDLNLVDMEQQDGALNLDIEGQTSELGAMLANPNSMV